ncbi:MAG TPA: SDR family NAD(P)-dependent oxidoreductase [Acidimicrobiales bacterium]|nr:SDR family NAD(P)-dependent oxidoreductase [Acidimicrobiales bacterium]
MTTADVSNNRSALVTGGASGLGAATVDALLADGWSVVALDRDPAGRTDDRLCEVKGDVTSPDDVAAAVAAATDMAPLRLAVHCAGMGVPGRTLNPDGTVMELDVFRHVVDVNLNGSFNVGRLAAAAMAGQERDEHGGRGLLVFTASCAAFDGQAGQVPYAAAKAAVAGMTLPLARDLAPVGVRVMTIAPGVFATPMYQPSDEVLDAAGPEARAFVENMHSRLEAEILNPRRPGRPAEYASLVLHLAANPYLNAEVIRLDAGLRPRAK